MVIVRFLVSLFMGWLLNYTSELQGRIVLIIAIVFCSFSSAYILIYWAYAFAGFKSLSLMAGLTLFLTGGKVLWALLLGYLISYTSTGLKYKHILTNELSPKIIQFTLWGITVLTAGTFFMATVGKWQSLVPMKAFFLASGYSINFLYFIMIAESMGAIGILLHFLLKTGGWAASGLAFVMTGAIYTHWHNHDPVTDSYAAIIQLLTLALMLVLYHREYQATSIYNQHTGLQ